MRRRYEVLIVLSLMLAIAWTPPLSGQANDQSPDKLSSTFSQAAMGALADIYRWREQAQAAAKSDVVPNLPPAGRPMKSVAYEHLRQAQMSATTQGDQQAGAMLQKHFSDVDAWVSKLIEARKNMDATNAIDPSSVDQDPDLVRMTTCEKAFNAMLGNGTFAPIAECQF
jgi:hypothetical protein